MSPFDTRHSLCILLNTLCIDWDTIFAFQQGNSTPTVQVGFGRCRGFLVVPFQESVPEVPNGTPNNNLISVGRECPSLRVACCVLRVACCVLQSRYCAPARGGRNARGMRCGIDGQHRGREHTSQNLSMGRARLRVRAYERTFP